VSWHESNAREGVTEWERDDGYATIRLRERTDGRFVVRFDRLVQAPEGDGYRRETVGTREAGERLAAAWREEFDGDDA
jgi:histidinol-phosphate/aromatic aminotransferase/cobyric acid decarboxylase-like protein